MLLGDFFVIILVLFILLSLSMLVKIYLVQSKKDGRPPNGLPSFSHLKELTSKNRTKVAIISGDVFRSISFVYKAGGERRCVRGDKSACNTYGFHKRLQDGGTQGHTHIYLRRTSFWHSSNGSTCNEWRILILKNLYTCSACPYGNPLCPYNDDTFPCFPL